jgi:FPC/CPF motif-containing protein YcgG
MNEIKSRSVMRRMMSTDPDKVFDEMKRLRDTAEKLAVASEDLLETMTGSKVNCFAQNAFRDALAEYRKEHPKAGG